MATPFQTRGPRRAHAGRRTAVLAGSALLVALVWAPLGATAGAATATTTTTSSATASTSITVRTGSTLTVNGPFHGFGVQDDNNLLPSPANQKLGSKGMRDFTSIVAPRLRVIRPTFARKMINLAWLYPGSPSPAGKGYDPSNPATYRANSKNARGVSVYTPNSPTMRALYTDLAALKRIGTDALLTISQVPGWMNPKGVQAAHLQIALPRAAADATHATIYAADIVHFVQLLRSKGYTNIAGLGAPNELAQGLYPISPTAPACPEISAYTPGQPTLLSTMQNLKSQMHVQHVQFQIFGPDSGRCEVVAAAADPAVAKVTSFFDYHDFNDLSCATSWAQQAIAAVKPTGRQVWISEAGGEGGGNCNATKILQGDVWNVMAPKVILAVNTGVAAMSLWSSSTIAYGTTLGSQIAWGLWGPPTTSKATRYQIRTNYYPWAELSSQTYGEHQVFASSCDTVSGCNGVAAAFLGNGKGHTTALLFNSGTSDQSVRIAFRRSTTGPSTSSRILGPATYTRYLTLPTSTVATLAKSGDPDQPKSAGVVHRTNGTLQLTLPAGSFTVLSN